eukprot:TCONS_00008938-protein
MQLVSYKLFLLIILENQNQSKMKTDKYFDRGPIYEYVLIIIGFSMLAFLVYHPEPEIYLGQLGFVGKLLLNLHLNYHKQLYNTLFISITIHILETLLIIKMAYSLNMTKSTVFKWAFQTWFLGVLSLMRLRRYRKEKLSKEK